MPQDTLGRELDGWITGGENESVVESQEIDFANAVSRSVHACMGSGAIGKRRRDPDVRS